MRTRVDSRYLIGFQDGAHTIIDEGVLVHEGNRITYVGDATYDEPCDVTIDARNRIVAPGMISSHTHMGGSPFDRTFREDVDDYWAIGLYEILMPIRDATAPTSTEAAARASCLELIRSGVTTAIDLTAWPEATVKAAEESGLRAHVGQYVRSSTWGTDGTGISFDPVGAEEERRLLDSATEFIHRHADPESRIKGIFAPAQIDTCSPELLREVHRLACEIDVPIQIHAGQSPAEFNEIMARSGMTPVEYLHDVGILDDRLIIGHCIFIAGHSWLRHPHSDDLRLLAESGATVAHCPTVFARSGKALENFAEYRKRGVRMALGVDTAPQSMLMEMRLAGAIARVLTRSESSVTARHVFDAATLGGAAALGRDDIGRLAVGAKADFVAYRTDTVTMAPLRDPLRAIVHHAGPADVDRVVIDGRTVLDDGAPTYGSETEIAAQLQLAGEQVWGDFEKHHHAGRTADEVSPLTAPRRP